MIVSTIIMQNTRKVRDKKNKNKKEVKKKTNLTESKKKVYNISK